VSSRRVELRIDEVVLRGLQADRDAIAAALGAELERLLRVDGGRRLEALGDRARIDAGSIPLRPGAGAAEVGRGIAGAVHQGVRS
jgi:hypothetical protein